MRWRKVKRSLLGFWVLSLILLCKCIFLFVAYNALKRLYSNSGTIPPSFHFRKFFTGINLVVYLVLIAEIIVYFSLRFKIKNKWWVRLHVWPLFIVTILAPLLAIGVGNVALNYWGPAGVQELDRYLDSIKFYLFWIIVPLSHIFFIATIVKIFKPKKEAQNDDTPPGLLDEFVD